MTTRTLVLIAAVLGFTGVALGAFGAHGLESTLEANDRTGTYQTASEYHVYHALALLGVAWLTDRTGTGSAGRRWAARAGMALTAGVVIFSGSLYVLAIADLGFMGAVAPIGGALLLAGWAALGYAAWLIWAD